MANFFASGPSWLSGRRWALSCGSCPSPVQLDVDVLARFLELLPRTTAQAAELAARHDDKVSDGRALVVAEADQPIRHALEFSSPTFAVDAALTSSCVEHGVSCVVADNAGRWPEVIEVTADFVYVRLHGDRELYTSGYSPAALSQWAEVLPWVVDYAAGGTSTSTSTTTPTDSRRTTRCPCVHDWRTISGCPETRSPPGTSSTSVARDVVPVALTLVAGFLGVGLGVVALLLRRLCQLFLGVLPGNSFLRGHVLELDGFFLVMAHAPSYPVPVG